MAQKARKVRLEKRHPKSWLVVHLEIPPWAAVVAMVIAVAMLAISLGLLKVVV